MIHRRPATAGPRSPITQPTPNGRALAVVALLLLLFGLPVVGQAQSLKVARYANTVDRPFATVSNGPQSAVVLDLPATATDADLNAATLAATRRLYHAQAQALAPRIAQMRQHGVLKGKGAYPVSQVIAARRGGILVRPAGIVGRAAGGVTRGVGGGTLTFSYTGFDSTDQAFLEQVQAAVYPVIVGVYGAPAVSGNVEVVNAGGEGSSLTDKQYLAYGVYDASSNRILLPTFASNESFVLAYILTMINAFHGPAVFQYDAWEQGFARAAASVVARQTATTVGVTDPSGNFLLDILPYYDLCNQPSLGNSTFFPPSQAQIAIDSQKSSASMFFTRLGMSGAAWLKVYIENPNFFAQFNAAYYAQFDSTVTPSLAGNIPALRAIASALLPNGVEGQPWDTWYQQQNILNTSNSVGEQVFSLTIPGTYNPSDATEGQSNALFVTYFVGQGNGDETLPASATAYATYLDATDARLDLGTAAGQSAIVSGEGGFTTLTFPTQGVDSGRITADIHIGNGSTRTYFPSGNVGDFQAVVLGPKSAGNASVTESTVPSVTVRSQSGPLTNAAFGVVLGVGANDLAVTTVTLDNGGAAPTTYKINTGDSMYYAVIRRGNTGGGTVTVSHTFTTSDLPSLVTFPVQPLNPIVDQALGLSGSAFVQSYWDVTKSAYETLIPGQASIAPIQMGRGYWFKLEPTAAYTSQAVTVTGWAPSTDVDYTLGLSYGWNLIGSPFAQPIDINDILVQFGDNDVIDFSDAVAKSLVAATPFSWSPDTGSYSTVTTIDGTNWEGYWLRVLVPGGVTLLLPGPDATGRAASVHRATLLRVRSAGVAATPAPDWQVRLQARQQGSVMLAGRSGQRNYQAKATLGVGRSVKATGFDNRYDLEAPPPVASSLTIGFPHRDWGDAKSTNRYQADYRSAAVAATATTWNVDVQTPVGGQVTLSWDGIGNVPKTTRLTLVDTATNTRTPLQTRSSYAFNATAGQTRSFEIVSEPQRSVPLSITPLFTQTTRSARVRSARSSIDVGYMLSAAADVQVTFTTVSGRVVHQVGTTRAVAALAQTAVWDGRGANGQALPAGPYLVQITARADDGTEARFTRLITLVQ